MDTQELISRFGEKIGISLSLEDGACAFEADGSLITVNDLPEIGAIALSGDLGEPPPERLEALYRTLLEANHLFRETAGATISLDPDAGRFALCKSLPAALLDQDSFFGEVERFVNAVESWSRLIRDFRSAAAEAAANDGEDAASAPALGSGGFLSV